MYSPQLVIEISRLLVMEVDAARAYGNLLAIVGPGPIRDELEVAAREHKEHVRAIRDEIAFRGYVVEEHTSHLEGIVLGASGPPPGPPTPEEALGAMRRNEQLAGALYARLLAKGPPDGARELLERLRADVDRARGWAERALAHRVWEGRGAGA